MMGGSSTCRERVARKVECKVSNRYLVKKAVDNSPFSVDDTQGSSVCPVRKTECKRCGKWCIKVYIGGESQ